ncbi:MAG: hypothetical protein HOC41_05890 [Candidatus Marinimicrobia bacterium]|jgi:hypothetical protein|nr:hypothetical protein [Candidatus Neomarinimicrobiota bacterium]MBT3848710.1 hypothetical protein [Candidatus Neomarinimicrobiota bacterium]MBT4555195.1 hypothetical protein [Candidatus Neomarinimicrobiota bacterium]
MAIGQSNKAQESKKYNVSLGMFDDRTGFSLIGYSYNLKQTEMDEYFVGAGTMIVGFTGTAGLNFRF